MTCGLSDTVFFHIDTLSVWPISTVVGKSTACLTDIDTTRFSFFVIFFVTVFAISIFALSSSSSHSLSGIVLSCTVRCTGRPLSPQSVEIWLLTNLRVGISVLVFCTVNGGTGKGWSTRYACCCLELFANFYSIDLFAGTRAPFFGSN